MRGSLDVLSAEVIRIALRAAPAAREANAEETTGWEVKRGDLLECRPFKRADMEQQIGFCTSSDGVRIAYGTAGAGAPLVEVSGWVSHLQFEWSQPEARAFWEDLARERTLVRYDQRGTGLSDWDVEEFSLEARVRDLSAVVEGLNLRRFALLGSAEGGPTAILYASRYPQRVSHLVLCNSFHRWPHDRDAGEAVLALIRDQWGMGSADLSAAVLPSGYPARVASFVEVQQAAASREAAAKIFQVTVALDVTSAVRDVRVPTLILHRRGDLLAPGSIAREMASLIPEAGLRSIGSEDSSPLAETRAISEAIVEFLREREPQTETAGQASSPITILFTDMEGSTSLTQRLGDAAAQEILRVHDSVVRKALSAHGGTETKHTGDGIMASFRSTSQGIECAIEIQRALTSPDRSSPGASIQLRIGLNAGEPIADGGDFFGTAVQLAARICEHAHPGQILVSNVVRELTAGKGFTFSQQPPVSLRGFEGPLTLYEVRWEV